MGKKNPSQVATRAGLSRDGRFLYVIDDAEVLSVHYITKTASASTRTVGNVLWKATNARWYCTLIAFFD